MPPVSAKQRRAMWAAAEGHSKLGIPQSVGREFVKSDAAGQPEGGDITDYEAAEMMRDGEIQSPLKYGDFWLFDMRITGTGIAYRDSIDEWAVRDPEKWLSPEFVERCNGLPVIFGHPEKSGLNHDEYLKRSVGQIVLPYIKGDEVWGIAKVYDATAAQLMQAEYRSTSPGVTPPKGSTPVTLENGVKILDEDLPLVLDHLAICESGVWDKDGPPEGIRLDALSRKDRSVATEAEREEELAAIKKERDDAIADRKKFDDDRKKLDDDRKHLDDARKHFDDDKKKWDDDRKHDAEEKEEEEREAEKAKEDARKKRHADAKHKGRFDRCDACDSAEEEEEKGDSRKDDDKKDDDKKDDDKRKDAAPEENIEANREEEIKDSKVFKDLLADHERLLKRVDALSTQPSIEDRNAIAATFARYDSLYQMLGDRTPVSIPGETPIAFRRRCADGLRKYTTTYKDYVIHDATDAMAFGLMEKAIIDEAETYARNPIADGSPGVLREVKSEEFGKHVSRFYGDANVAWTPFMPVRRIAIKRFNKNPDRR